MKKYLFIVILLVSTQFCKSQNLIENPGFEKHVNNGFGCVAGGGLSINNMFNVAPPNDCVVQDWITISQSPDGFWYNGGDFPVNELSHYIYPHSDSVCVGMGFYIQNMPNTREIIEGKLMKPLIKEHHYQFGMYVQLCDSFYWSGVGKIAGINSFSAVFTNTAIPNYIDLPIQNYTPQVQIDSMVTDTQHWVLLMDTFMANGGEQFVSIGNFKQDGQFQSQVVITKIPNSARIAYYYIDDVSLIDLDDTTNGVQEQLAVKSNQLMVYPNPAKESIVVSCMSLVNTVEVTDLLGRIQMVRQAHHDGDVLAVDSPLERLQIPKESGGLGGFELNTDNLPSGIYFIKATDINGNVSVGKFVKE